MERLHDRAALSDQARHAALDCVIDRSRVMVFLWRIADRFPVEFVTENVRQLGYTADDFLSGRVQWNAITHPEDHARLREEVAGFIERGIHGFDQSYRIFDAQGNLRIIEDYTTAILNEAGEPTHFQGIVIDVTETRRQHEELTRHRQWQRCLLDTAADGIIVCDRDGTIIDANPAAVTLCGYPLRHIVGTALTAFIPGEEIEMKPLDIDRVMAGHIVRNERRMRRADGSEATLESSAHRIDDRHFIAILRDISDRVRWAETMTHARETLKRQVRERTEALYSAHEYLKTMVSTSDDGILVVDADGRFEFANGATYRILDRVPDLTLGRHFIEVIPEDMHAHILARWREVQAGLGRPYEVDILTGPGARRTVQVSHRHMDIAGTRKYCVVVRDITNQKREAWELQQHRDRLETTVAERTQALRELTMRNERLMEAEHRRIAREIHDELGQTMTAMKLDLHWLHRHTEAPDARSRCEDLIRLSEDAIRAVNRIVTALRPALLEDEGLAAAAEWHAADFSRRTGIACRTDIAVDAPLPSAAEHTAFRVIQETLTNIARHARATHVSISVRQTGNSLGIDIKDNGRGLAHAEADAPGGLGIVGMRERVQEARGEFAITDRSGEGVHIAVRLPLPPTQMKEP